MNNGSFNGSGPYVDQYMCQGWEYLCLIVHSPIRKVLNLLLNRISALTMGLLDSFNIPTTSWVMTAG